MNPQDDPEARIRELERPLADVARTSELGTTPYLGGAAPYDAAPPRKPWVFRAWFWVLGFVAVGLIVGGAGVAFFTAGSPVPERGQPERTIAEPPSAQPTNPVGEPAISVPPGEMLTVSGIGEIKTIACNDSSISVSGIDNTVTIVGHCAKVTVSGVDNQVTVESAASITASGFDNRVTYHSGSPEVTKVGGSNTVEQG